MKKKRVVKVIDHAQIAVERENMYINSIGLCTNEIVKAKININAAKIQQFWK